MKSILFILLSLISSTILKAQNVNFKWAKGIGGNGPLDVSLAVAVDNAGNVYTSGFFTGTVDFDPGPAVYNLISAGGPDIFVYKSDLAGNFLWAKRMGGAGDDLSTSLCLDANGNVYITGRFDDVVDFDPGACVYDLTPVSATDMFISKLDSAGNFVSAQQIGGLAPNSSNFITADANNNIFLNGNFSGTVDFDPGAGVFNMTASAPAFQDIFVCKLGPAGNFLWAKQIGVTALNFVFDIAIDPGGNVYTTGDFRGTADFDPGPAFFNITSAGNYDSYLFKLDPSGNFLWANQVGSTITDAAYSVATDATGNVFTIGNFSGTVDFDPGPGIFSLTGSASYIENCYIMKQGAAGNFLWAKQISATAISGTSLVIDINGNVISTGDFKGTADFDPGPGTNNFTSTGNYDVFVSALDPNGDFIWAKQIGGTGEGIGNSIAADRFGSVYTTGELLGTMDFDPGPGTFNLTSPAGFRMFIQKMGPCTTNTASSLTVTDCKNYILNGRTYTSSGVYQQTIFNAAGCDSVITLNLTINRIQSDQYVAACSSFTWHCQPVNNCNVITTQCKTYTTSGVYTDTVVTPNACDSIITLHLTISTTAFNSSVTATACDSYNWNGQIITTSGVYSDTLKAITGCDSIITLNLTVNKTSPATTTITTACDNYSWNGKTFSASGLYSDTLVNSNGCDSIVSLDLKINQKSLPPTFTATACNSYVWQGQTLTASGFYSDTLVNSNGCDSIVSLNLKINNSSINATINATACDSYVWQGRTLMASGLYSDTLVNANGCDSIVSLDLKINNSSIDATINATACDSYLWQGRILTVSGLYIDTLLNSNGCDSIVSLNLKINQKSLAPTITAAACNSYVWQGQTLTVSGLYSDTLVNSNGCDSIVSLDLKINNGSVDAPINATACNNFPWQGATLTASGLYIDTLQNVNGCDSVVSLNLTINISPPNTITKAAACDSYNWNGNTFNASGNYQDTLIAVNGCDSVITLQLTISKSSNSVVNQTICQGQAYQGYTATGTYTDTLVAANGCDSIRVLSLTVMPTPIPELGENLNVCTGDSLVLYPGPFDSYLWQNGTTQPTLTIKQGGLYAVVVTNSCGSTRDEAVVTDGFCNVYFPSAFTPNNDGKNDLFKVLGTINLTEYQLVVYNRFGQKIFETSNPTTGWTGNFNGQLQPVGVYVWNCTLKKPNIAKKLILKGTVMLLR